ncbi:MAG: hypothetical protein Q7R34_01580, partial [Dehalococcoidia bacterium]|nr:hypothetical protein [Dehalococcoidia bacterium]
MCNTEWFIEVIPFLPETAIKVLSILTKSPRQGVTPQGRPVLTSSLSLQELTKRANLSRRGVQQGLAILEECNLVTRYPSRDPRGPTTYSIPLIDVSSKALRSLKKGVQILHPPN